MKKKFINIVGLLCILSLGLTSCFDEDEPYAKNLGTDGDILVSIPEGALALPPVNQSKIVQPSLNVVAARFAISDDVKMNIALTEGLTNLKINTLVTTSGVRQEKASFTNVSGSVDWTYPVNTLGINNAAPGVGTGVVLELVASNSDGSKQVKRTFTVNVLDPLTTTFPATAFADSTVAIVYTVPANTTVGTVNTVEIFVKRGRLGAESLYATKSYTNTVTATETLNFKMPAENPSGALDTMFFRVRATYETGRTVTKSPTIRFRNVPIATTPVASSLPLQLYNSAVTGANSAKTGYDLGKLQLVATSAAEATKDIKLLVSGIDVGLTVGTGNASRLLKVAASNFTSPTFQSLRNLFNAPTATPVTSVANVFIGDVFIVEIDGNTSSAKYGIIRITDVVLTPATDNTDNITFEVKVK